MLRNKLKSWRHKYEMTQTEFVKFLEVSYTQYNRWENNQVQPDIYSLWKIKKKLNCSIEELIEESPE